MKKTILLLVLLIGCTSVSYEEHTDAGSKYVLDNGLTVIMKDNPDTGMVAIDTLIKRSIAADGDKHGLSHFTNRLLLAGTAERSREAIARDIEAAGGSISQRTYAEYSELLIEVPSDQLSTALDVLQDVLLNPAFDPAEIEKERTTLLGELEAKQDDPNILSEELFMSALYNGHPYQHPIDGYPETVERITRDDITNHHRAWYAPQNIIISIAGNIKQKATITALDQLLGNMKRGTTTEEPRHLDALPTRNISRHMNLESFYIQHGYLTPPAVHPDFIPLRFASMLLGRGSGSRLFYELRDKKALAYSVYTVAPSTRATGFLKVAMFSRPDVLNESLAGIQAELDKLKTSPVPEDELQRVKQKTIGWYFLDHQRAKDQANYLALYEIQNLGYHHDIEYTQKIRNVKAEELQYVANTYFTNPATSVLGPFHEAAIQ